VRAFLGLGSNLGDRWAILRRAVAGLRERDVVVAVSPVYETDPVGGPGGQDRYLNLVVELDTDRQPRQLLALAQALEREAGRRREVHWGPRTLDVDVLLIGDIRVEEEDLVVPHPNMWTRRFVLAPLSDLAPELVPQGWESRAEGRVEPAGRL
jgi:2-amino-4-hydroxy-6-hydroxymethyldihydropteridine diphosphokinase